MLPLITTALTAWQLATFLHLDGDTDLAQHLRRAFQGLEPDEDVTLWLSPLDRASALPLLDLYDLEFRGYRA